MLLMRIHSSLRPWWDSHNALASLFNKIIVTVIKDESHHRGGDKIIHYKKQGFK